MNRPPSTSPATDTVLPATRRHAMPFGASVLPEGGVEFRLWAPAARNVQLCRYPSGREVQQAMAAQPDGWYTLTLPEAQAGDRYRYRIDGDLAVPDPASRFQPDDVHAASEVIDPDAFRWSDDTWRGRPWTEAVLYELHVGSFTPEGTFRAIIGKLDHLVSLGVTAIELMPVADFPGRRNWGYDGVLPFAPDACFGRPEDLKALVDTAHARGLMVFLDVVYNHFGPDGNYLHAYAPDFFTERHHTPWGAAINFDGNHSRTVRDFFIHNALYWLEEFHFDGLRLDAVHAILDDSTPDILEELAVAVRTGPGQRRAVHLVLENDHNAAHYLTGHVAGRPGYDAQWNDDAHHALHVLVSGETAGYYSDYADDPIRHLGRCLTEGFAWQGEPSPYRDDAQRGEPSTQLPLTAFVNFLQNHDQVGNRAFGERLTVLAPEAALRAATIVLLLSPSPPLLFMGQEWGSVCPFPFFCDFHGDLAQAVTEGRRREFARFPAFQDPQARERIPDPNAEATFRSAVLDWPALDAHGHRAWLDLHRELLALRRQELVPRLDKGRPARARWDALSDRALRIEWVLDDGCRLTLLANLGPRDVPAVLRPPGRLLYASHSPTSTHHRLPPWSVAWYLAAS